MFCKNCGKELADDVKFCPSCGTERMGLTEYESVQEMGAGTPAEQLNMETGSGHPEAGGSKARGNIISKIWNSALFMTAAVRFGNILEILEGIIFMILSAFLFREGGFWGVGFGILFGVGGLGSCINGVKSLVSCKKDGDKSEMPDGATINKKKRNLCIGIVVIVLGLIIINKTGGGTYVLVRSIAFDDFGTETIGELVDENIKSPEWSQKKLDSNSKLVYVEGYCPAYGGNVRIAFYYEKVEDDSYEVSLNGIYLPDSGEELGTLEAAVLWSSFYN